MIELIKIPIVSLYYLVHVIFDKWINYQLVIAAVILAILGWKLAEKGVVVGKRWRQSLCSWLILLYAGILIWVVQYGGLQKGVYEIILYIVYIIGVLFSSLQIGNTTFFNLMKAEKEAVDLESDTGYRRINIGSIIIFLVSMIPVIILSPYTFARADDYGFGYGAHLVLENGGNIFQVIRAAAEMVSQKYMEWQGTYTSIFFMALHPAVFHEKLYRIVPLFFILVITLSSYFFMKTIFFDLLKADHSMSRTCIFSYILLVIQCIPVKQSAYFWYNGALHYIIAHSLLLCMLVFLIRLAQEKSTGWDYLGAVLTAVYIGGSNYVTLVSTLLLYLTLFFVFLLTKTGKKYKNIIAIGVIYLIAAAINILAPGNFKKMGTAQGYGLVKSFIFAFTQSLECMLGEWLHWSVFIFMAISVPVLWNAVKKVRFSFSYPLLVVVYSWCYMASLFFMPLFTKATIDMGRLKNIMFLQWMLWILIDLGYCIGWIQRRYLGKERNCCIINSGKYYGKLLGLTLIMASLSFIAEPQQYTTAFVIETLRDNKLQEYAADYWHNIKILEGQEKEVTLKPLDNIPQLLNPEECEAWYSGLRLFYNKDKIYFEE